MNTLDYIKQNLHKDLIYIPLDEISTKGHGNVLSVKIVIPTHCQAACKFCFNKITKKTQKHDFSVFMSNLQNSIDVIGSVYHNRHITIDITGNEPTFNLDELMQFLEVIADFKEKHSNIVDKVVITSNGFALSKLKDISEKAYSAIDIINVSLHHYIYSKRKDIFGTALIPDNDELIDIVRDSHKAGKIISSVAVYDCSTKDKTPDDFKRFVKEFAKFSFNVGFNDARIRLDYLREDCTKPFFDCQIMDDEIIEHQQGLSTKRIHTPDKYPVTIFRGVDDLTKHVIGVELVIDDDGLLYLDYSKRYPVSSEEIAGFEKGIYLPKL